MTFNPKPLMDISKVAKMLAGLAPGFAERFGLDPTELEDYLISFRDANLSIPPPPQPPKHSPAVMNLVLNSLHQNKEFVLYTNPEQELDTLLKDLDTKLGNYFVDPFVQLPVSDEILGKLVERMESGNWSSNTTKQLNVQTIGRVVRGLNAKEKRIARERLLEAGDSKFVERLLAKTKEDRLETIRYWLGKDIENVERQVYEDEQDTPLTLTNVVDKLLQLYKDSRTTSGLWKESGKKGYPTRKWVRTTLLKYLRPKLIPELTTRLGKKPTDVDILVEWLNREIDVVSAM